MNLPNKLTLLRVVLVIPFVAFLLLPQIPHHYLWATLVFAAASLTGAMHNDPFFMEEDRVRTRTNFSGGIQGGISNGEDIILHLAFKPTATIMMPQDTVTDAHEATTLRGKGRHDPCVLPRAVPIVEAMAWLVLADHFLRQRAISH